MSSSSSLPFVSLHESPLYVMEQSHRFTHISGLSTQLQKVTKLLGHYTSLGSQLCGVLKDIIGSLNEIEFVCTNPVFNGLMNSINEIESSLESHFDSITNSSEKVMRKFVKTELPVLTELKKNHMKQKEKYFLNQEKLLSISKKNKKLFDEKQSELDDLLNESTQTFYDFVTKIEQDESEIEGLIARFLLNFPKSFVESTKNLKHVEESLIDKTFSPQKNKADNHHVRENRALMVNSIPVSIKKMHSHLPHNSTNNVTTKQGFLFRKKKGATKKWSRNLFSCANGFLSYSKTVENAHNPTYSMNLAIATVQNNDTDDRLFVFNVVTPEKTLTLQALSLYDYEEWMAVIRNGILYALEKGEVPIPLPSSNLNNSSGSFSLFTNLASSSENFTLESLKTDKTMNCSGSISNFSSYISVDDAVCADCGAPNAEWIIANKAVSICDKCAGVHRGLSGISIIKSLKLDKVDIYYKKMRDFLPENQINKFYESLLENKNELIQPDSDVTKRQQFIERKYVKTEFADKKLPQKDIFTLIKDQDIENLMKFLFIQKLDKIRYPNNFLPLHAAAIAGNPLVVAIILTNSEELNQVDDFGWTPISYATYYNNKQVVEVLLSFHANLNATKSAHPCQIALYSANEDMLDVFNQYVAISEIAVEHANCYEGPFHVDPKISENFSKIPNEDINVDFEKEIQLIHQQHLAKHPVNSNKMTPKDMLQIQKAIENMGKNKGRRKRSLRKEDFQSIVGNLHED
ncbi:centaurin gamma [Tritrichomonas foetus]|uniref:Centaurin gamma n=1 Tax=Tritrichomonas foetus TaxID=1144522 RepID=A0A1J4JRV5_9EUKA|nr:centaurin gamma [Tritrichomonas foetus]|eukprot:OHT01160.1 centaurin gamma [Tritrichomonas foetus]